MNVWLWISQFVVQTPLYITMFQLLWLLTTCRPFWSLGFSWCFQRRSPWLMNEEDMHIERSALAEKSNGGLQENLRQKCRRSLDQCWGWYIDSWDREWMWRQTQNKSRKIVLNWVVSGIKEGSLVWDADGSCKRKVASNVSGLEWIGHGTKPHQEKRKVLWSEVS